MARKERQSEVTLRIPNEAIGVAIKGDMPNDKKHRYLMEISRLDSITDHHRDQRSSTQAVGDNAPQKNRQNGIASHHQDGHSTNANGIRDGYLATPGAHRSSRVSVGSRSAHNAHGDYLGGSGRRHANMVRRSPSGNFYSTNSGRQMRKVGRPSQNRAYTRSAGPSHSHRHSHAPHPHGHSHPQEALDHSPIHGHIVDPNHHQYHPAYPSHHAQPSGVAQRMVTPSAVTSMMDPHHEFYPSPYHTAPMHVDAHAHAPPGGYHSPEHGGFHVPASPHMMMSHGPQTPEMPQISAANAVPAKFGRKKVMMESGRGYEPEGHGEIVYCSPNEGLPYDMQAIYAHQTLHTWTAKPSVVTHRPRSHSSSSSSADAGQAGRPVTAMGTGTTHYTNPRSSVKASSAPNLPNGQSSSLNQANMNSSHSTVVATPMMSSSLAQNHPSTMMVGASMQHSAPSNSIRSGVDGRIRIQPPPGLNSPHFEYGGPFAPVVRPVRPGQQLSASHSTPVDANASPFTRVDDVPVAVAHQRSASATTISLNPNIQRTSSLTSSPELMQAAPIVRHAAHAHSIVQPHGQMMQPHGQMMQPHGQMMQPHYHQPQHDDFVHHAPHHDHDVNNYQRYLLVPVCEICETAMMHQTRGAPVNMTGAMPRCPHGLRPTSSSFDYRYESQSSSEAPESIRAVRKPKKASDKRTANADHSVSARSRGTSIHSPKPVARGAKSPVAHSRPRPEGIPHDGLDYYDKKQFYPRPYKNKEYIR